MCFFPYNLLVPKILRTLMMILPLKLRSLSLKFIFLQAVVPRQRSMMTRLRDRLKARVLTNTFSAVSPSNTAISPTLRKSLYVDPSQYPDDPDMPALEDITYSDDEEDVEEPKRVHQALKDPRWIEAMQEELLQFKMQKEEGIDYEEVFALVARIEAIRLFLAYASFMGFMVYQMDVKSAFLYGTIEEEALYGLHQAPRAWYETLANYIIENGFQRGKIDQTLFIKKQKGDILLVQVYVNDIIFGSTNKDLCKAFEKLMKDKF
nr:hypothetical protein [Tanacetum cinerariifolium]